MAHEVETMAYAGEVPWHGIGEPVLPDLSPEQMLEKAGCDWMVRLDPVCSVRADGKFGPIIPGHKALVRESDDKFLSMVRDEWRPVQNATAFGFFAEFVERGEMEMHTAGSLKGGKRVWALAKIKDGGFKVNGKDPVESHLLFVNPHEYGRAIQILYTNIRVVCNNTMTLALKKGSVNQVSLHHRQEFNPDFVKDVLGLAHEKDRQLGEAAEFLASRQATQETLEKYFADVLGTKKSDGTPKRKVQKALEAMEVQPGFEDTKYTFWGAFNAVTFLNKHIVGRSADARMTSNWLGANGRQNNLAFTKALEYAQAA